MSQQPDEQQQPAKWPQFIGPILILLLAMGAAVFGVMWSSDDDNTAPIEDASEAPETPETTAPDAGPYLEDVQMQYPDADPAHQEALAVAEAETDNYIMSEQILSQILTTPEYEYNFEQAAADFAVENVEVDWNQHAHQFMVEIVNQAPEVTPEELRELLHESPEGPQFTAEQTEYALSQLN